MTYFETEMFLGFYVKNTTNEIFSLSYILDMGNFSDKELALAINYLEYLGMQKNKIKVKMYLMMVMVCHAMGLQMVKLLLSLMEE